MLVVNNIIKHANANEVNIQLIKHDNELNLLIEDNGMGFDLNEAMEKGGIGLKNIQSISIRRKNRFKIKGEI